MDGRSKKSTATSTLDRWWQKTTIKTGVEMQNRPWLDCFWQVGLHYMKQKHTTKVENESVEWMLTPGNHVQEWNMVPQ